MDSCFLAALVGSVCADLVRGELALFMVTGYGSDAGRGVTMLLFRYSISISFLLGQARIFELWRDIGKGFHDLAQWGPLLDRQRLLVFQIEKGRSAIWSGRRRNGVCWGNEEG